MRVRSTQREHRDLDRLGDIAAPPHATVHQDFNLPTDSSHNFRQVLSDAETPSPAAVRGLRLRPLERLHRQRGGRHRNEGPCTMGPGQIFRIHTRVFPGLLRHGKRESTSDQTPLDLLWNPRRFQALERRHQKEGGEPTGVRKNVGKRAAGNSAGAKFLRRCADRVRVFQLAAYRGQYRRRSSQQHHSHGQWRPRLPDGLRSDRGWYQRGKLLNIRHPLLVTGDGWQSVDGSTRPVPAQHQTHHPHASGVCADRSEDGREGHLTGTVTDVCSYKLAIHAGADEERCVAKGAAVSASVTSASAPPSR